MAEFGVLGQKEHMELVEKDMKEKQRLDKERYEREKREQEAHEQALYEQEQREIERQEREQYEHELQEARYHRPEKTIDELLSNTFIAMSLDALALNILAGDKKELGHNLSISRDEDRIVFMDGDKEVSKDEVQKKLAEGTPDIKKENYEHLQAVVREAKANVEEKKKEEQNQDKIHEHSVKKDFYKGIESKVNTMETGVGTERIGQKLKREQQALDDELTR